jgi:hypothetical protein
LARGPAAAGAAFTALVLLGAGSVAAYPVTPTPAPTASSSPSPPPSGNTLPFDSNLTVVLDDALSSSTSRAGQVISAHLKDAISVGGQVVAPSGTPVKIRIVSASAADIGDVYGFVDVFFEPMTLPDGRLLPLRAPVARLEPHVSAGHESTVEWEDTIEDQVVPYHFLYHIFRKGKNFVLKAGSELPARTEATVTVLKNGTVAIETPRPLAEDLQMPKATFPTQVPATPFGPAGETKSRKTPSPVTTPSPTPWPTPEPPTPTPSASASP